MGNYPPTASSIEYPNKNILYSLAKDGGENDSLDCKQDIEKLLENTKIWKIIFTQMNLQNDDLKSKF